MRVELDETMFRLVAPDDTPSELVPYGGAAMLEYEGVKYYCFIDDPNDTPHVMRIDQETEVEAGAEETEFEIEGQSDNDDDDDDDDDGGEALEEEDEPQEVEVD